MYLRQSTASQTRSIGPFVDDTDFKTAETALTIANTDVKLMKNGGAAASKNSGGGTHLANGMYAFTFNATDTDTVGELKGIIPIAGALLVPFRFVVVEEVVYDSLYAASAPGYIVPSDLAVIATGTAQAGAADSITLSAGTSFATDLIQGATVHIVSGTGAGQSRIGHAWNNTTKVFSTSPNWGTNPDSTSVFKLIATPPAGTSSPPQVNVVKFGSTTVTGKDLGAGVTLDDGAVTAAKIASDAITAAKVATGALTSSKFATGAFGAVWDESQSLHLGAGSVGLALQSAGSSGDPWSTTLPGVYAANTAGNIVGNRLNAAVGSRAAPSDVPSAATIALAVLASVVEGTRTLKGVLRLIFSTTVLKSSGLPLNPKYQDEAGAKNRVTAISDINGNRSSVTLDDS